MSRRAVRKPTLSWTPRRIGIIGYDDVQALDVTGPLDVFASANARATGARPYDLIVLGPTRRAFRSEAGLRFVPDVGLERCPPLDTVIIPGGRALRLDARLRARLSRWLVERGAAVRRVCSVCSGVYALAESGLLAGRRVTTHWQFAEDLARRWPSLRVDADAIWVKDGRYYTSAGISAGIDLALALVEEDHGPAPAGDVARELVVYLRRSGGQRQYSAALQFQNAARGELAHVVGWITENLGAKLSLESLAETMHVSTRHVTRTFRSAFDKTPAHFIEDLRLETARWRLTDEQASVETVAQSVGYRSADVFRRAFERRYGVPPSDYRRHFSRAGTG